MNLETIGLQSRLKYTIILYRNQFDFRKGKYNAQRIFINQGYETPKKTKDLFTMGSLYYMFIDINAKVGSV
jgi:hypothetical protein